MRRGFGAKKGSRVFGRGYKLKGRSIQTFQKRKQYLQCNKKGGRSSSSVVEMTKHERIISMFEIGSRAGRRCQVAEPAGGGNGKRRQSG